MIIELSKIKETTVNCSTKTKIKQTNVNVFAAFLHQGIMMVQCTCLLLLLLSTAAFSQNYDKFIVKHTLVKANGKKDCDTLMKDVNALETPGECKGKNTFIVERDEKIIQDMCKAVSKKQYVNLPYNCFDCVTKDIMEPCSYTQIKPNEKKRILCEKDQSKNKFLPVHLEAGSA